MQRLLQDNPLENDDKALPSEPIYIEDVTTSSPTPTDIFPVELRTSPPTPTALLPPFLKTMSPSFMPTKEPTTRWNKFEISIQSEEYANTSNTVIFSIVLSIILCLTCIYCVCCRRGKESIELTQAGKRDFNYHNSSGAPLRSPRERVEVINPYSREDQPLLSPPRNRPARRERDQTPVRTARVLYSSPMMEGYGSDSLTGAASDLDDHI